jgi:hypothetical protein
MSKTKQIRMAAQFAVSWCNRMAATSARRKAYWRQAARSMRKLEGEFYKRYRHRTFASPDPNPQFCFRGREAYVRRLARRRPTLPSELAVNFVQARFPRSSPSKVHAMWERALATCRVGTRRTIREAA